MLYHNELELICVRITGNMGDGCSKLFACDCDDSRRHLRNLEFASTSYINLNDSTEEFDIINPIYFGKFFFRLIMSTIICMPVIAFNFTLYFLSLTQTLSVVDEWMSISTLTLAIILCAYLILTAAFTLFFFMQRRKRHCCTVITTTRCTYFIVSKCTLIILMAWMVWNIIVLAKTEYVNTESMLMQVMYTLSLLWTLLLFIGLILYSAYKTKIDNSFGLDV